MLAAAARLLRRQGYAATGWRQVVAEGEAPWGSQAHFFPGGKVQLATEALAAEGERLRREIEAALEQVHPADMVLGWAALAARQLKASGWAEGCPIATAALETAHVSDALAGVCNGALTSWIETFADAMVARGVAVQEARALATIVVAGMEGALLLARAGRDGAPLATVASEVATVLRERVP
jgi:TetR/AcrR family transcriptional repressor of lmrAB and yxaGH operons